MPEPYIWFCLKAEEKMSKINESIICAGFGGQGIMILGKVLASAGMASGLEVTYLPAYGVEVRGGTAYSMIKISSSLIGSPVVLEADTAIIMNEPSLDKFENAVKRGGLMILNTSMSGRSSSRKDIEAVGVPLTDEAMKLGNAKVANIIAAGVFMQRRKVLDKAVMVKVIEGLAGGKKELAEINIMALERGMELGKK